MAVPSEQYEIHWKDYYKILAVDFQAELEVINAAYKALVKKYHPDKGGDTEKIKDINESYDHLSDPKRRAKYDLVYKQNQKPSQSTSKPQSTGSTNKKTIDPKFVLILEFFSSGQCSWCSRFYTQPLLCPYKQQIRSSCLLFSKIGELDRAKFLDEGIWQRQAIDWVYRTRTNGIVKWCRKCGTLNANPQTPSCWKCKYTHLSFVKSF